MSIPETKKAVSYKINSYCEHNIHRHIKDGKFQLEDMIYHCKIKFLELLESQDERHANPEAKDKHLKFIEETVKEWTSKHQTLAQTIYNLLKPTKLV